MSWPMVKLDNVISFIRGVTFKPEDQVEPHSDGSIVVMRTKNVQASGLDERDLIAIPSVMIKREELVLKNGDILISSANSWELVGKVSYVNQLGYRATAGGFISIVRAIDNIVDSRYLYHWLSSSTSQHLIRHCGRQTTNISNLDVGRFKELEIPLPPLAEQKRIAAILDKAAAIRRKRQQAIQLADDFLRAVFLEMFGDPVTNPKGWEVKLLKDIAKIQIGPFGTQLHKEDYVSNGIPLINPSHIKNSEVVPDFNLTVSKSKFAELTEYHLAVGDIIMGRRGEMGRCALIGEREAGWLCGTGSLYIRPFVNNAQSFYLFKYLTSDYIKTYLEGESLGATMPNLNKTIVGNIKVPMPSTEAITKFQKILAADKTYREKITLIDDSLFESLSHKAFSSQF